MWIERGREGERERVLTISIVTTEIYHKVSLQSLYNPVLALDKILLRTIRLKLIFRRTRVAMNPTSHQRHEKDTNGHRIIQGSGCSDNLGFKVYIQLIAGLGSKYELGFC